MTFYILVSLKILALIFSGIIVYSLIRRGMGILSQKQYIPEGMEILIRGIARWLIFLFVILLSLPIVGISVSEAWTAVSAFLVLTAIGFVAFWSVLSNIMCSVFLILFTPFHLGDTIEVVETTGATGIKGKVIDLNVLFTTLEEASPDKEIRSVIRVPNNIFFQKSVRVLESNGKDNKTSRASDTTGDSATSNLLK